MYEHETNMCILPGKTRSRIVYNMNMILVIIRAWDI